MQIKSEWELLKNIESLIDKKGLVKSNDLLQSIGDDCAVFKINDNKLGLITTDISIEGVHFKRGLIPFNDIGYKAMMANISDITAMGGEPRFAFISLGIPEGLGKKDVLAIYDGLLEAGNSAGLIIAGGDTSKAKELILNIALYGETAKKNLVRRKGTKTGDLIYVTGSLGDSMAGLEILLSRNRKQVKKYGSLTDKHKRPTARFAVINEILKKFKPTSMIDISDGLLSDLRHICETNKVGFKLSEDMLPMSRELKEYSTALDKSCYDYALNSGEEYELLFTSSKELLQGIIIKGIPVTPIGRITDNGYYLIRNNKQIKIPITGYDHFK
ncbi:MAG: thiamine-phosphate kinase [Spirochaetota bacterium]